LVSKNQAEEIEWSVKRSVSLSPLTSHTSKNILLFDRWILESGVAIRLFTR